MRGKFAAKSTSVSIKSSYPKNRPVVSEPSKVMEMQICQREHEFILVLTGTAALSREQEDALFEAGCDDATISLRNGRVYLTFCREAPSLKEAIISALVNVHEANIGMDVLRVGNCNLVSLADIARRLKRTRQCVHQYMLGTRGPGGFPPPICELCDGHFLWRWCEVACWLYDNDMISEEVFLDAEVIELINNVLEFRRQRHSRPELTEEVLKCCP